MQSAHDLEEGTYEVCMRMYGKHNVRVIEVSKQDTCSPPLTIFSVLACARLFKICPQLWRRRERCWGAARVQVRFCPALHQQQGLSVDEVVGAVTAGYAKAEKEIVETDTAGLGIRGGIIVCALRSYPPAHTSDMVALVRRWLGKGVVGLDLAGDEGTYPLKIHADPIREAVAAGVPVTGTALCVVFVACATLCAMSAQCVCQWHRCIHVTLACPPYRMSVHNMTPPVNETACVR